MEEQYRQQTDLEKESEIEALQQILFGEELDKLRQELNQIKASYLDSNKEYSTDIKELKEHVDAMESRIVQLIETKHLHLLRILYRLAPHLNQGNSSTQ